MKINSKRNKFFLFHPNIFTYDNDIIILNLIGFLNVDFVSNFLFIFRSIFYLKISLLSSYNIPHLLKVKIYKHNHI